MRNECKKEAARKSRFFFVNSEFGVRNAEWKVCRRGLPQSAADKQDSASADAAKGLCDRPLETFAPLLVLEDSIMNAPIKGWMGRSPSRGVQGARSPRLRYFDSFTSFCSSAMKVEMSVNWR